MVLLAYLYLMFLLAWVVLHMVFGDRWWFLFLLNSVALYLFVPLVGVVGLAFFQRNMMLWGGVLVALFIFGVRYAPVLIPSRAAHPQECATELTVMSFNVMGIKRSGAPVVAAIRKAGADVVVLQEVSEEVGGCIWTNLAEEYPYQAFDIPPGKGGMGTISRFPLQPVSADLPGDWMGNPQSFRVDVAGYDITLLNIHAINISGSSSLFPTPARIEQATRKREEQARTLRAFAEMYPERLIVLGDFNTGDQSTAYAILVEQLGDSWRERGWGPGHTFPGSVFIGERVPGFSRIVFPFWFIRIDYIFHSKDWRVCAVRTGPWDGVSDHRPVVARLFR